jgi:YbgC/YbaW family acyl-CoA thioester hydrolase
VPETAETALTPPDGAFRTSLRVHFSDCDAQGIVFNAHYLRFVDNTVEQWFDSKPELGGEHVWDFVVKKAEVEWASSARATTLVYVTIDLESGRPVPVPASFRTALG